MNDGCKDTQGKREWGLLPYDEIEEVIKVLEFGKLKYGAFNWTKVEDAHTFYIDAAQRHIAEIRKAKTLYEMEMLTWEEYQECILDHETKLPHHAHAICSLLFALWHEYNFFKLKEEREDDRP